jgi:hypothetical protein
MVEVDESGLRCVNIKYQESISYSKEELKIIIDKTIDKFYKHNFSLTKRNER